MRNDPRGFDQNAERRSEDRRFAGSKRRVRRRPARAGYHRKGMSLKLQLILAAIGAALVIAGIVVLICYLTRGTVHSLPTIVLPTEEPTAEPAAEQQTDTQQTGEVQPEPTAALTEDGLPIL